MTCLLVAMLCAHEPCIVFFLGSGDFGTCCHFPFIHGAGDFVPVQRFAVDSFAYAFPEPYNGSFSVKGLAGCEGKPFKGGYVGVNVPPGHSELHQLVIRVLLFGCVHPGVVKRPLKLCPKHLVILVYMVWLGGVHTSYQVAFLGIHPVVDHRSLDVGEGSEYSIVCFGHGIMGAINHFVLPELCPEFIC